MSEPRCTVCLSFDFDAISAWLPLEPPAPGPLSRGEFGARVGVPRVLELLARHGIPATFFVPGHTVETFPDAVREVARAGHELGCHGYLHETPLKLSREQEREVLDRSRALVAEAWGRQPQGYRAPSWAPSPHTLGLVAEAGFRYDSSLMADDFRPYRPRLGDRLGEDGRLERGIESELVEIPVSWALDDWPYFGYVQGRGMVPGRPGHVLEVWQAAFDYAYQRVEGAVFCLTMHPQLIGQSHAIGVLEALVSHMRQQPGVAFRRMGEVAIEWHAAHGGASA